MPLLSIPQITIVENFNISPGRMSRVESDLIPWLNQRLRDLAWSQRELARRADVSASTISDVTAGKRPPSWDFCAAIARPLGVDPDEIFVLAGLKRPPPAPVAEENEVLAILRRLPGSVRDVVIAMLRGLARDGQPRVSEGLAPYRWDQEPWVRELVEEFRNVPEEWREEALRQVQFVRQMSQRPTTRFVGEDEEERQELA